MAPPKDRTQVSLTTGKDTIWAPEAQLGVGESKCIGFPVTPDSGSVSVGFESVIVLIVWACFYSLRVLPLIGRMVGIILVFVLRRQNCAVTKHYLNKFETVPFKPCIGYCGFGGRIVYMVDKAWCQKSELAGASSCLTSSLSFWFLTTSFRCPTFSKTNFQSLPLF